MTDTSQLILATSIVLFVSCICSLLEAALYSLSPGQVETLAGQGRTSGRILKRLKEDVDRPISAILSLNTLANTGGAAIAGAAFVGAFGESYEAYFTGALAMSVLIFSEVLPKTAGVVFARTLAPIIARPIWNGARQGIVYGINLTLALFTRLSRRIMLAGILLQKPSCLVDQLPQGCILRP